MPDIETTSEYELYRSLRLQGRSHEMAAGLLSPMCDADRIDELKQTYDMRRMRIFQLSEPAFAAEGYSEPSAYDGLRLEGHLLARRAPAHGAEGPSGSRSVHR